MGSYVYKVLAKTVKLENGEKAHVALFAYKYSFWADTAKLDFTTGVSTCERAAADGKRGRWVIMGHKEADGTISISSPAFQLPHPQGSFVDDGLPWGKMESCPALVSSIRA